MNAIYAIAKGDAKTLRNLAAALENLPPLAAPELITSDCTPEAARDLLARNGEKLAIVSAEIDAGQLMGSRHAKTGAPNIDLILKGYTGDPAPSHRVGKDVPLARPALAFVLCVQPKALRDVLGDRTAKDRGLVPRLCLVAPESRMGTRLDLNPGEGPPRVLTLNPEARAVFDVLRRDLETRNGPDGDLRPLTAFTSKLPGSVARIALALEALGNPAAERITGETMRAACEWAPWLIAHARHVLGDAAEPDEVKNARRLLRAIKRKGLTELSEREAFNVCHGVATMEKMENMKPALQILSEGEWLRELPEPHKPNGGRPSVRYAVNPAALA